MIRRVIGCMTGTSIDGIDAALVEIEGTGLAMKPRLIRGVSHDLGPVRDPLRRLADQQPMTAADIAAAMRDFALVHVKAIAELLAGERCHLICVHGQTVFHKPPVSWQLMQPGPIAREFNTPVVFDLRAMDLAAGGQGAPITPIADWVLFRHEMVDSIVNLGGFCNYSDIPDENEMDDWDQTLEERVGLIDAADVCACNQLLDALARGRFNLPFDTDGTLAMRGLLRDPVREEVANLLRDQAASKRSLGTGDEVAQLVERHRSLRGEDVLRSACEGIADVIASCPVGSRPVFAGGGVRNRALMRALKDRLPYLKTTAEFGIPIEQREAVCFAILGALCQDRAPITVPRVTGVKTPPPISGAWIYP